MGPDASSERVESFLAAVRAAAATTHQHLQTVYAAGRDPSGVYAVCEWDGAVSLADRLAAGETLPIGEFLPNAAGLADALAALHRAGGVHGAIDVSSIHFSAAHPAKLGGLGNPPTSSDPVDDVRALAAALVHAITGDPDPGVGPSQLVEGLPAAIDDVLDDARRGRLDAEGLAARLRAIPSPTRTPAPRLALVPWAATFAAISVAIAVIAAAGLAVGTASTSPFLYPIAAPSRPAVPPLPTSPPPEPAAPTATLSARALVFDPLGDGTESDDLVGRVLDGDPETSWVTEAYSRPLEEIKPGVGLVFVVEGIPAVVEIVGSPGTRWRLGWTGRSAELPDEFEPVASGVLLPARNPIPLPRREGGRWLLWLVELPATEDGRHRAEIAEVRFLSAFDPESSG